MTRNTSNKGLERRPSWVRSRSMLLALLPVLVLGCSYFLFIEYLFSQANSQFDEYVSVLRIGGFILVALALLLAFACGVLLLGRMARPIRLLSRMAETGELPSGTGSLFSGKDWDLFYLYKRLQALVQQSRVGAQATEELESVNASITALKDGLQESGPHGAPKLNEAILGPVSEIGSILQGQRQARADFVADLRARTEALRREVEESRAVASSAVELLAERVREDSPVRPTSPHAHTVEEAATPNGSGGNGHHGGEPSHPLESGERPLLSTEPPASWTQGPTGVNVETLEEAAERVRRLGIVLSLEMERIVPDEAGLGKRHDRFMQELEKMQAALAQVAEAIVLDVSNMETRAPSDDTSREAALVESNLLHWDHLEESLGSLERRLDEVFDR